MITDNIDGCSDGTTCSKMNLHVFSIEPMPVDEGCKYVLTCVDTDTGSYKYFHANKQELNNYQVSHPIHCYIWAFTENQLCQIHIFYNEV